MAELNENFCMICGTTKNDPKSITCGHPKCINTVLECIKDEGEFSMVARQNNIDSPKKLKEYFEKMDDLKIDVEFMFEVLDIKQFKDLLEKLQLILEVFKIVDLQKALNNIKLTIEKLD